MCFFFHEEPVLVENEFCALLGEFSGPTHRQEGLHCEYTNVHLVLLVKSVQHQWNRPIAPWQKSEATLGNCHDDAIFLQECGPRVRSNERQHVAEVNALCEDSLYEHSEDVAGVGDGMVKRRRSWKARCSRAKPLGIALGCSDCANVAFASWVLGWSSPTSAPHPGLTWSKAIGVVVELGRTIVTLDDQVAGFLDAAFWEGIHSPTGGRLLSALGCALPQCSQRGDAKMPRAAEGNPSESNLK